MRKFLVLFFLLALPAALAQTLVEITTVLAIQSTLNSNVRFPSGSFQVGKGKENIIARMPDAAKFNLEVNAARGIAVKLQADFIHQALTSFALAGYLAGAPIEQTVNGETRIRYDLTDENGKAAVLFVVRKGDELVYAFGVAK